MSTWVVEFPRNTAGARVRGGLNLFDMEVRPWSPPRPAAHDLSKAPGFALGPMTVDPPTRTVIAGERRETLEPRVMRVLVALADVTGRVLSRDDLIALCWDGQIVGDNAIARVISRLRHVLAELAGDAVKLETITKVGFRLRVESQVPDPPPPVAESPHEQASDASRSLQRWGTSRRMAIGGVAVAAVSAGAISFGALRPGGSRHTPKPDALELYERGMAIQKSAGAGTTRQAMTFYRSAVAIDPDYADAWGALAIAYRHGLDDFTSEEKLAYPRLLRSAARRALALDPGQRDANLALVLAYPNYRRWNAIEQPLRRMVGRYPDYWYGHAQLGLLLQDVGRFDEALPHSRRVTEIDPLLPVAWAMLARGYASAGRDHEADAALDEGFRRWPAHPYLWFTRFALLMNRQSFAEAAVFVRDPRTLPDQFPQRLPRIYGDFAEGLSTGDNRKIAGGLDYLRKAIAGEGNGAIDAVPRIAPLLALAGAHDDALAAFEAYFLGGKLFGRTIPPPRELDLRFCQALFVPPIHAPRNARFISLLERTGLEDYWHRSGSQPDFRRS